MVRQQYISLVADESDSLAVRAPAVHRETGTLRILGTSVTQIAAVKDAAKSDLGIKLDFITLDGAAAQQRSALQPRSFDVYDQWFHDLDEPQQIFSYVLGTS